MSVATVVNALLLLSSLAVAVPAAMLCLQVLAASRRRRRTSGVATLASPEGVVAVLMPAHDEADGIRAAIDAVTAQLRPGDRLLVVADNCSDATAAVAREAGAEVAERFDPGRRGKGYALDHGVRALEAAPPAAVVILDADCILAPGALEHLRVRCLQHRGPVQALYLMHAPAGASRGVRVAEFAWRVKNKLRPIGSRVLGWPCQLMGTGMAFPWELLRHAPLASGHLVEDMELGVQLAASGHPPLFCEEAVVRSSFPSSTEAVRSQRTRWEHGHLSLITRAGPRLLGLGLLRGKPTLVAMAIDLMVPPLAALALVLAALLAIDGAWWAATGLAAPFAAAAAGTLLATVAVVTAWYQAGRDLVSAREMLYLPFYVAAKVPIYIRLFTRRQIEWVRTRRDGSAR